MCHVHKLVYTISQHDPCIGIGHSEILDKKLGAILKQCKNEIHEKSRVWDTFKKQTNSFELVFTTSTEFPSIAGVSPVSRSYFKHWEVLHDFEAELGVLWRREGGLTCAFMAEGPGGFIEAFVKWRRAGVEGGAGRGDALYGITLLSADRTVPTWRFSRAFLSENNISLLSGRDGTGSLYNLDNIRDYVDTIGANRCQYVTADGGFDFSGNFDDQEADGFWLILCEIYAALLLQAPQGAFLCKIYDTNLEKTRQLLFILFKCYDSVTMIKPHTSRPANSEKYVLCRGFCGKEAAGAFLRVLSGAIESGVWSGQGVDISNEFVESLCMYNVFFTMKQIININLTISHIEMEGAAARGVDENVKKNENIRAQAENALRWCFKYKVPINTKSLQLLNLEKK